MDLDYKVNLLYSLNYSKTNKNINVDVDSIDLQNISLNDIKFKHIDSKDYNIILTDILTGKFKLICYNKHNYSTILKRYSDNFSLYMSITPYTDLNKIDDFEDSNNMDSLISYLFSHLVLNKKIKHILLPVLNIDTEFQQISDILKSYTSYEDYIRLLENEEITNMFSIKVKENFFKGSIMENYLKTNKCTLKPILFQTFHTLAIIQDEYKGFRHNKLNLKNIYLYIKKNKKECVLYYYNDKKYYLKESDIDIKITNFTNSKIPQNYSNDKNIPFNDKENDYFDIHYFLNNIYHSDYFDIACNKETKTFFDKVLPKKYRNKTNNYYLEENVELFKPKDLLDDEYFAEYADKPKNYTDVMSENNYYTNYSIKNVVNKSKDKNNIINVLMESDNNSVLGNQKVVFLTRNIKDVKDDTKLTRIDVDNNNSDSNNSDSNNSDIEQKGGGGIEALPINRIYNDPFNTNDKRTVFKQNKEDEQHNKRKNKSGVVNFPNNSPFNPQAANKRSFIKPNFKKTEEKPKPWESKEEYTIKDKKLPEHTPSDNESDKSDNDPKKEGSSFLNPFDTKDKAKVREVRNNEIMKIEPKEPEKISTQTIYKNPDFYKPRKFKEKDVWDRDHDKLPKKKTYPQGSIDEKPSDKSKPFDKVETDTQTQSSDNDSSMSDYSQKSKQFRKFNKDKPRYDSDKSRYDSDKPRYDSDKSRNDSDKSSNDSDKSRYDSDKSRNDSDKSRNDSDKSRNDSDKSRYDSDKSRNDSDKSRYDSDKSRNDSYKPRNDSDKPRYDSDKPRNDSYKPRYDSDKPRNDSYKPRNDSDKPRNDSYKPRYDSDKPRNDSYKPRNDYDKPRNDSYKPRNDYDKPRNDSYKPRNDYDKPRNDSYKPRNDSWNSDKPRYDSDKPRYDQRRDSRDSNSKYDSKPKYNSDVRQMPVLAEQKIYQPDLKPQASHTHPKYDNPGFIPLGGEETYPPGFVYDYDSMPWPMSAPLKKRNEIPLQKVYNIKLGNPSSNDHTMLNMLYEDIVPGDPYTYSMVKIHDRQRIIKFINNSVQPNNNEILQLTLETDRNDAKSLLSYFRMLQFNPYGLGNQNPYSDIPVNFLLYNMAYPVRYDGSNLGIAKTSLGLNLRIYSLSNGALWNTDRLSNFQLKKLNPKLKHLKVAKQHLEEVNKPTPDLSITNAITNIDSKEGIERDLLSTDINRWKAERYKVNVPGPEERFVSWRDYDVWREIHYYEYIRDVILQRKISPNFITILFHAIDTYSNIDYTQLESVIQSNRGAGGYLDLLYGNSKKAHQDLDSQPYSYDQIDAAGNPVPGTTKQSNKLTDLFGVNANIEDKLSGRSGVSLLAVTEAPTTSMHQWGKPIYDRKGNLFKMISTGDHSEKVWYSVLFQLMYAVAVMEEHELLFFDFDLDNIFIKDLYINYHSLNYWLYKVDGFNFYVPNYGYLVLVDSRYKDHSRGLYGNNRTQELDDQITGDDQIFKLILDPNGEVNKFSSSLKDNTHIISGKNNIITENHYKYLINIFEKILGELNPPPMIMTKIDNIIGYLKPIKTDLDNLNGQIYGTRDNVKNLLENRKALLKKTKIKDLLGKSFPELLHNRIGTPILKSEKDNLMEGVLPKMEPGNLVVYMKNFDEYEWAIIESMSDDPTKVNVITKTNGNYNVNDLKFKSELLNYSNNEDVAHDKDGNVNYSSSGLIETYRFE